MNEIWKDIPNYEGIYQVSNLGRVKSLSFKCWISKNNSFGTRKEKIASAVYQSKIEEIVP